MESVNYMDLQKNMAQHVQIFESVIKTNNLFRQSIIEKDWSSVNKNIDQLNELSLEVNKLDTKRVDILITIAQTLNSKENENLLSIIHKAPHDLHDQLIVEFYKLKSAIIQVQGVFKGLNRFVEHKKDLSKEIIDILVKDAKGNVYSKPGRRDDARQGFLVNRQL